MLYLENSHQLEFVYVNLMFGIRCVTLILQNLWFKKKKGKELVQTCLS